MKCPICGGAELIHETRDLPHEYYGEKAILPEIEGDYCPVCGDGVLDMVNATRFSNLMSEFNKLHASTTQKA